MRRVEEKVKNRDEIHDFRQIFAQISIFRRSKFRFRSFLNILNHLASSDTSTRQIFVNQFDSDLATSNGIFNQTS